MLSKRTACASVVFLLLTVTSLSYALEPATVHFDATGKITENSCQLSPEQDITISPVAFDKLHDINYISGHGSDENATLVVLDATQCTPGQVNASILGASDLTNADLLAIDTSSADSAKNMAIAFMSESSNGAMTLVPVNTGFANAINGSDNTNHRFIFMVQPVKYVNLTPIAGKIHATAQLRINYL